MSVPGDAGPVDQDVCVVVPGPAEGPVTMIFSAASWTTSEEADGVVCLSVRNAAGTEVATFDAWVGVYLASAFKAFSL